MVAVARSGSICRPRGRSVRSARAVFLLIPMCCGVHTAFSRRQALWFTGIEPYRGYVLVVCRNGCSALAFLSRAPRTSRSSMHRRFNCCSRFALAHPGDHRLRARGPRGGRYRVPSRFSNICFNGNVCAVFDGDAEPSHRGVSFTSGDKAAFEFGSLFLQRWHKAA